MIDSDLARPPRACFGLAVPRGRGAGRVVVFGLLKRGGKVYAKGEDNAGTATRMPVIQRKITPNSVVHAGSFGSYDALDVSQFHHVRINHSREFARGRNHINGIENFCNQGQAHPAQVQRRSKDSRPSGAASRAIRRS